MKKNIFLVLVMMLFIVLTGCFHETNVPSEDETGEDVWSTYVAKDSSGDPYFSIDYPAGWDAAKEDGEESFLFGGEDGVLNYFVNIHPKEEEQTDQTCQEFSEARIETITQGFEDQSLSYEKVFSEVTFDNRKAYKYFFTLGEGDKKGIYLYSYHENFIIEFGKVNDSEQFDDEQELLDEILDSFKFM